MVLYKFIPYLLVHQNGYSSIINGDTTEYLYDAANRLAAVDGAPYTFDANGNLLSTGVMTNVWDAANRLTEVSRNCIGSDGNGLLPESNNALK